jgi:hypothetical protein
MGEHFFFGDGFFREVIFLSFVTLFRGVMNFVLYTRVNGMSLDGVFCDFSGSRIQSKSVGRRV